MGIEKAAKNVKNFEGNSLTNTLYDIETAFHGANRVDSENLRKRFHLDSELIFSAIELKKVAAQINVIIHALGILLALPRILHANERIDYLSLGAGNTGRKFDLETNIRIAEFKFINWQGGSETIRQNSIFKDFYELAEHRTDKKRYLYVLGTQVPLRFFNGARAIKSVLSRNNKLSQEFIDNYGNRFKVVNEYYLHKKERVVMEDISDLVPELKNKK